MFPATWSIHEETDRQIGHWSLVHKRSYSYNTTQILPWNQSAIIGKRTKGTRVWYGIFMYNQLQYGYRLHPIGVKDLKTHHPCNAGAWNFVFVGCPGAPHSCPGMFLELPNLNPCRHVIATGEAVAPVYSNVSATQAPWARGDEHGYETLWNVTVVAVYFCISMFTRLMRSPTTVELSSARFSAVKIWPTDLEIWPSGQLNLSLESKDRW